MDKKAIEKIATDDDDSLRVVKIYGCKDDRVVFDSTSILELVDTTNMSQEDYCRINNFVCDGPNPDRLLVPGCNETMSSSAMNCTLMSVYRAGENITESTEPVRCKLLTSSTKKTELFSEARYKMKTSFPCRQPLVRGCG